MSLSPPLLAGDLPPAGVSPGAAAVQAAWPAPADDGPPLRLSQMIAKPAAGRRPPLWMSAPDVPPQLQVARDLKPAVAAGATPGAAVLAAAAGAPGESGEVGETVGGLPVGRPLGLLETTAAGAPAADGRGIAGSGWEIPPIRWGGSLGYSYQHSSNNAGYTSVTQGIFANLTASSYIYAPWFARVSGRLGITTNSTENSAGEGGQSDSNRSSNVVGGGEVNMFSSSRYPFRTYFDRSDSRGSGTLVTTDYVSNRYGISQGLRSEDGMSNGNFMLDRSNINSSDGRRDDVTALSASYSTITGVVQNNINGRYSLGEQSGTGNRASLIGLNTSHTANLSDTLSLGGVMNYTDSDIRTASGLGASSSTRGRYLQLYTYGSWLPEFEDLEDLPLTLTGGLRYTNQETTFDAAGASAQSLGGNLSALYRFSRNLSVYGNAALTRITQGQGLTQTLTQLGSGVNYTGDVLTFGKYSYNWNTGAGVNWQSAIGTTEANAVSNGQFSHSLSRVVMLSPGQALSLNGSQTVNATNSQNTGSTQSLTHTLSGNLGLAGGERFSGSLSAMLSDIQTTGYIEQHYRVLNLGMYGQGQLSQVSSATVNLMFNWADQSYQTVDAFGMQTMQTSQRMTLNGMAAYSHQRFASVRGLRYNLIFTADSRLRDERLYGNVNGEVERSRYSLTNRLEYRVGLLDFRLSLINNDAGGKKNALLFFQVARQIGSY